MLFLKLYVQAYDMGSPSKTSTTNATVTIDIYRNLRDPLFSGGPFAVNINETTFIGTSVLQVNFSDSDTDVSIIFLTGYFKTCRGCFYKDRREFLK